MKKILFLMLSLICFVAQAGTIDPGTPDSKYLEYGSQYKCVRPIKGNCNCKENKEPHKFHASCVLFRPRWALTAAHVVKNTSEVVVIVGEKEYKIKRVIIKKEFDDSVLGMNDIALCYSEEDFRMEFYPKLYEKNEEVGKVAGICGYGLTGTFSSGAIKSDGNKRAGSNIVEKIERECLVCTNIGGPKTELEFLIGSGDSGGGLFIDGQLAGINSFVSAIDGKPNSDYGDESSHTRISMYLDWINEQIEKTEKEHE